MKEEECLGTTSTRGSEGLSRLAERWFIISFWRVLWWACRGVWQPPDHRYGVAGSPGDDKSDKRPNQCHALRWVFSFLSWPQEPPASPEQAVPRQVAACEGRWAKEDERSGSAVGLRP